MIVTIDPSTLALLDASDAMIPSGTPVPNFSGCRKNLARGVVSVPATAA